MKSDGMSFAIATVTFSIFEQELNR